MIHFMLLCRNEMSRKLENKHHIFTQVLTFAIKVSDRLVIIDDNSDDKITYQYLADLAKMLKFTEAKKENGIKTK